MQPPPLAAQFEDRRSGKPRQLLREIDAAFSMSAAAPRLDVVAAVPIIVPLRPASSCRALSNRRIVHEPFSAVRIGQRHARFRSHMTRLAGLSEDPLAHAFSIISSCRVGAHANV
jgi:hypothetical protein